MLKKFKNKIYFILISVFFSMTLIIPFANVSADTSYSTYPFPYYSVNQPSAFEATAYDDENVHISYDNLKITDEYYFEMYTDGFPPYSNDYMMTWNFTDTYNYELGPELFLPDDPDDLVITELNLVLNAKDDYPVNPGHFSVCWDFPTEAYTLENPQDKGNWTISGDTTYYDGSGWPLNYDYGDIIRYDNLFTWKLWDYEEGVGVGIHNFSVNDVISEYSLRVMWNFTDGPIESYFDYLGLQYVFFVNTAEPPVENPDFYVPEVTFATNIYALIWMLIIFFPALAIGEFVPKIGFAIGMVLMLIIIGSTQSGFMPVTILGIITIAIMMYKEGD